MAVDPLPRLALVAALCVGTTMQPIALRSQPSRPQPPPPRVQRYDPDSFTCRPEEIESAHRSQLLPWADQGEAVLKRLRAVQAEMLRASLRRCQERGLLNPEQSRSLEGRLAPAPAPNPTPGGPAP
jgi:hypothetical protein